METCNEKWEIEFRTRENTGERYFQFHRYINGKITESYRPATKDEALVWAAALLCGFQPPRFLDHSHTPSDKTQSEQKHPDLSPDKIQDHQSTLRLPCGASVTVQSVL